MIAEAQYGLNETYRRFGPYVTGRRCAIGSLLADGICGISSWRVLTGQDSHDKTARMSMRPPMATGGE